MSDNNNKRNIPLGLNMNDFMPNSSGNSIPESNDPKIINDVMKNAPNFKLLMSTRIKNLNNISEIWDNARNKTDSFDYINELGDLGVINDVLNFAFIKTELPITDTIVLEIATDIAFTLSFSFSFSCI